MDDALKTLGAELSANEVRLSVISNKIQKLMQESERIKKNNGHISYTIDLFKNRSASPPTHERRDVDSDRPPILENKPGLIRKTLRSTLLDFAETGKPITVGKAWELAKEQGFNVTRAVVNTTLNRLAKGGYLVQPETGLYQKAV